MSGRHTLKDNTHDELMVFILLLEKKNMQLDTARRGKTGWRVTFSKIETVIQL